MDTGESGDERSIGKLDLHGINAACLVPASCIKGLPEIIGICDDPAKPRDLIFGDVTALESENRSKDPFPSLAF